MKKHSLAEAKRKRAIRGELKTVFCSDNNYLSLPKMSALGIRSLKIKGKTEEEQNVGDGGLSVRLLKKNLIDVDKLAELIISYKGNYTATIVEVDGRRCIKFMNTTLRLKDFTECCPEFKPKTRYIFSFEARPSTVPAEDAPYEYQLYMGLSPEGISPFKGLNAKKTTNFTRIYNVNKEGSTVTDLYFSWGAMYYWLIDLDSVYLYEYEGNTDPEYQAPSKERADISSFVLDSSEIPVSLKQNEYIEMMDGEVKYKCQEQEYNLTDTAFGKSLLSFSGSYDSDHTLMVKGAISPLEIEAEYYTTGQGDTVTLKVKYLCGDSEILEPKEYITRKNGAFTVIAPSISGYKPKRHQISGVTQGDTEVIIEYMEARK